MGKNIEDQNQISQAPKQQVKHYRRDWKRLLLFYLLIGAVIYTGIYHFILIKQTSNPYTSTSPSSELNQDSTAVNTTNPPSDEPEKIINAIYQKTQGLKSSDIFIDKNPEFFPGSVWWISDDNYNILTPTESSLLFQSKAKDNDFNDNTFANVLSKPGMQIFLDMATDELTRKGFKKNIKNSSTSLTDDQFVDYVQAYEKEDTKCTVTVNPGAIGVDPKYNDVLFFAISLSCTDNFDTNYKTQLPFLKALNLKDVVVSVDKHEGDFYMLQVHARRTGYYIIAKKEGDTYRQITSGQDLPPCDKMEANQVPKSIYGQCYDTKTGKLDS